jgi:hypothetical protein
MVLEFRGRRRYCLHLPIDRNGTSALSVRSPGGDGHLRWRIYGNRRWWIRTSTPSTTTAWKQQSYYLGRNKRPVSPDNPVLEGGPNNKRQRQ